MTEREQKAYEALFAAVARCRPAEVPEIVRDAWNAVTDVREAERDKVRAGGFDFATVCPEYERVCPLCSTQIRRAEKAEAEVKRLKSASPFRTFKNCNFTYDAFSILCEGMGPGQAIDMAGSVVGSGDLRCGRAVEGG